MAATPRVLFIFLDGVGIGLDDPDVNPFARARIPTLLELMGGSLPTLVRPSTSGPRGTAFPLTATLDVEGTPQSGTGQAALLTGENAAAIHGRHFGPWTPVRLRPLVEERSLLRRAVAGGRKVAFANAYPRWWPGPRGGLRIAAPPLAARGAGLLTRHQEALESGDAVSSEIVNDAWRDQLGHDRIPVVTPAEAGANLARIADGHELTLYAHYATDAAGHLGEMADGVEAVGRVDVFLEGVVSGLGPDVLTLIASDHGNLEDVTGGHTTNPVLGVAAGPSAVMASKLRDIRDVSPFILDLLGVEA
jgi:2,3-bisphosphoglycerate-independent phosphoglycerate mutase